jgi:hypothetical protein
MNYLNRILSHITSISDTSSNNDEGMVKDPRNMSFPGGSVWYGSPERHKMYPPLFNNLTSELKDIVRLCGLFASKIYEYLYRSIARWFSMPDIDNISILGFSGLLAVPVPGSKLPKMSMDTKITNAMATNSFIVGRYNITMTNSIRKF